MCKSAKTFATMSSTKHACKHTRSWARSRSPINRHFHLKIAHFQSNFTESWGILYQKHLEMSIEWRRMAISVPMPMTFNLFIIKPWCTVDDLSIKWFLHRIHYIYHTVWMKIINCCWRVHWKNIAAEGSESPGKNHSGMLPWNICCGVMGGIKFYSASNILPQTFIWFFFQLLSVLSFVLVCKDHMK